MFRLTQEVKQYNQLELAEFTKLCQKIDECNNKITKMLIETRLALSDVAPMFIKDKNVNFYILVKLSNAFIYKLADELGSAADYCKKIILC